MAVLTKQRTDASLGDLRARAVRLCAAAYAPQEVKQPDGSTLRLCWNGRIARGYEKLAIARIARDAAAIAKLQEGIDKLSALYADAAAQAEQAASTWAAASCVAGAAVQAEEVYPPPCTCEGCAAQKAYQDKTTWRAHYVTTLYDFLAPTSTDTPPLLVLMRRIRADKNDKAALDQLWAHLRRISDCAEAYAKACADAGSAPNWRALWPDEE